jgi:hypothetical protein
MANQEFDGSIPPQRIPEFSVDFQTDKIVSLAYREFAYFGIELVKKLKIAEMKAKADEMRRPGFELWQPYVLLQEKHLSMIQTARQANLIELQVEIYIEESKIGYEID